MSTEGNLKKNKELFSPKMPIFSPKTTTRNRFPDNEPCSEKADNMKVGMSVYVRCEKEGWIPGLLSEVNGAAITVKTSHSSICSQLKDVVLRNNTADFIHTQDLTHLSPLSTPAVLECLETRYLSDSIYTEAGSTLVAVNPFKDIPGLYDSASIQCYHTNSAQNSPHVYKTSETVYRHLCYDIDQSGYSVIVSGESGAGKTVTAKHIMKYLVTVANHATGDDKYYAISSPGKGYRIERRILDSNPILEAFGNASTLRNHNSSRFGKYIQLHFNRVNQIEGASIETYLLEKTRVVHQTPGEFNFHIFYQMLYGGEKCIQDILTPSGQSQPPQFEALNSHKENKEHCISQWHTLRSAMTEIGLTSEKQTSVFKLLSSILHLCNIKFSCDEDFDDVAFIDPEIPVSSSSCEHASVLLGVDPGKLETILTHRRITASHSRRKSVFQKPCTPDQAASRRDCLAKLLYASLFDWLVGVINKSISSSTQHKTVGILDIYGFESFEKNRLEQLCINYANEKLQQHFVTHFLRDLQEDYANEAIPWTFTSFSDNRPCLQLLEDVPGIFSILTEECQLNRAPNDEALQDRLLGTLNENLHLDRARTNLRHPGFVVYHYAQPVHYTVEGLLEKNMDNVPAELVDTLQNSTNKFICHLFDNFEVDLPGKKKKTVLSKFKVSLDSLMNKLNRTTASYIRCIKPNSASLPGKFERTYIVDQLKACGVVETVSISKQGYPARLSYDKFLQQYGLILRASSNSNITPPQNNTENKENEEIFEPLDILYNKQLNITLRRRNTSGKRSLRRRAGLSNSDHTRKLCATILQSVFSTPHHSQFGKTKLFLRDGQLERLEAERARLLGLNAFTIQCAWRRMKARRERRRVASAVRIQSAIRGWQQRKEYLMKLAAIIRIQSAFRKYRTSEQLKEADIQRTPTNSRVSSMSFGEFYTPFTPGQFTSRSEFTTPELTPKTSQPQVAVVTPIMSPAHAKQGSGTRQPSVKTHLSYTNCDENSNDQSTEDTYIVTSEQTPAKIVFNVTESPVKRAKGAKTISEVYKTVGAAIQAAFLTQRRFHLSGAFAGIPYFEAQNGVVSRRRMPRVQIKFHTKPNSVIRCGHYMPQYEVQCSLTDCLDGLD